VARLRLNGERWKAVRNAILFFGGLAGVIHETLVAGVAEPLLLVLYASMMGLPALLHRDERRNEHREEPPPP
jgi:hypothetical protein